MALKRDSGSNNTRDLMLFILGINLGLRMGDLLRIQVKDVRNLKVGDTIQIKEQKTGKLNVIGMNKTCHKILKQFLDENKPDDSEYLFKSRKGDNKPLSVPTVNGKIKEWTKSINLKGNYGTHSLRKTFGYIQRVKHNVGFEVLCKRFSHSSPSITMKYIGVESKEVVGILMNEI